MERDYRADERRESRAMDTKSRNEFKPRAMRSEFQNRLRDDLPRRQFEDFGSEAGSDDDKRREKLHSVPSESPTKSDRRFQAIDTALTPAGPTFSSVSEFPQKARNLTTEQYV